MLTILAIINKYRFSPHHAAVADLVVVALFYLLQVGEYTASRSCCPKGTIPLWKCDVPLWRNGQILDHESDPATLLGADSATISIANTKNSTKGTFVRHHATGKDICPVAALAPRMANLWGMRASTQISTVCHPPTRTTRVWDRDVTIAVQ